MDEFMHKISYLRGLAKGLDVSQESKEGRIISELIEIIDGLAREVNALKATQAEQEEYLEAIDEDLDDLEALVYDDEEWEDDGYAYADEDEYDDDVGYFEVECPHCHEAIAVEQDVFEDDTVAEVLCPECREVILVNDDVNDDGDEGRKTFADAGDERKTETDNRKREEKNAYV
ncbi:hypothetical protein BSNK01_06540 [Bacillaceae bacterium]